MVLTPDKTVVLLVPVEGSPFKEEKRGQLMNLLSSLKERTKKREEGR
jgi:hypothetical protein